MKPCPICNGTIIESDDVIHECQECLFSCDHEFWDSLPRQADAELKTDTLRGLLEWAEHDDTLNAAEQAELAQWLAARGKTAAALGGHSARLDQIFIERVERNRQHTEERAS